MSKLPPDKYVWIKLKKQGCTYGEIAKKIIELDMPPTKEATIRKWFSRNKAEVADATKIKIIPPSKIKEDKFEPFIWIPDLHFPYEHPNTFDFLDYVMNRFGIRKAKCAGDMFDIHRVSRHTPEPESHGVLDEIRLAKDSVQKLSKLFPELDVCLGNHDMRIIKVAKSIGIPSVMLKDVGDIFDCPDKWRWAGEFVEANILCTHAGQSGFQGTANYAISRMKSVCVGHNHSFGGVNYVNNGYERLFALNGGCLINFDSPAFVYAKESKYKPTYGCGVVLSPEEAQFIPL